jgi:hypothetical protein
MVNINTTSQWRTQVLRVISTSTQKVRWKVVTVLKYMVQVILNVDTSYRQLHAPAAFPPGTY